MSGKAGKRAAAGDVSETVARYLEAIFYMRGEGEAVRATRLAEWLGLSLPTTTATVGRMVRDSLLRVGPEREIQLTRKGNEIAAGIVRRHRIVERWLVDVLKLDWLEADVEAGRLEHGVSDDVAERLHAQIGRPETCPHGNAIPGTAAGREPERALSSLRAGQSARLRRISEVAEREAPELLRFLADNRFTLDGRIDVLDVSRGAGTVTVKVDGRRVSMSSEVAGKIWVDV